MQISVIIPVYNQWTLTRSCLLSLAETVPGNNYEVFVLDNASTDTTPAEAPGLGRALFARRFHYHRFEDNRNFGPACNFGARQSTAEYLLFLNNDIVLRPGWLAPLFLDFQNYRGIAGTSPLLMYPEETPLGPTVQHLGISLSPLRKLLHLYEGIPAASALAGKRRFFRMITAACMLVPRRLFQGAGGFDETFINGFEDVDFCARLGARGYRFTVNPASRVFHHTSQTPGRKKHEAHNAARLNETAPGLSQPDLEQYLADDGLEYRLSPWLEWEILPGGDGQSLPDALPDLPETEIQKRILEQPYRLNCFLGLAGSRLRRGDLAGALALWNYTLALSPRPEYRLLLTRELARLDAQQALARHLPSLLLPCRPLRDYERHSRDKAASLRAAGQTDSARAYESWLEKMPLLYAEIIFPYYRDLSDLLAEHGTGNETRISDTKACQLWLAAGQDKLHAALYGPAPAPGETPTCPRPPAGQIFSVVSMAHSGDRELRASLESLQAQSLPDWEWLIAFAPEQPGLAQALQALAESEPRLRPCPLAGLGPEGAADQAPFLNAALALARNEFILPLTPGDRLVPEALSRLADVMHIHPEAVLTFADEDGCPRGLAAKPLHWEPLSLLEGEDPGQPAVWRRRFLIGLGGWASGYPGAEAYDMTLRGAESSALAAPGAVLHLPEVLLRRASSVLPGSAGQARRFRVKALQHHLKRQGIRGRAAFDPDIPFLLRINAELPAPVPRVSIIMDAACREGLPDDLLPSAAERLREGTAYPDWELLIGSSDERPAVRLNRIAAGAGGELLLFLDSGLFPCEASWLETMIRFLAARPRGLAILGARLIGPDGRIDNLGFGGNHAGELVPLYRGLEKDAPGYMGLARATRSLPSVDPRLLLIRKSDFEISGGFDPSFDPAPAFDLCLRAARQGMRAAVCPQVSFRLADNSPPPWERDRQTFLSLLRRTHGPIPPLIPALAEENADSPLHWLPFCRDAPQSRSIAERLPPFPLLSSDGRVPRRGPA